MIKIYNRKGIPFYLAKENIIKITYALDENFLVTRIFFKVGNPIDSYEPIEGVANKIMMTSLDVDLSVLLTNMKIAGMPETDSGLPLDEIEGRLSYKASYGDKSAEQFSPVIKEYHEQIVKYVKDYKQYRASGF